MTDAAAWVKVGRGEQGKQSGGRGGTQLIDFKNKALVYLYLDSLLPLCHRGFYRQPGGLVPRARGRIYRLPPLPPTSKTRGTEDWMLGAPCCSRWGPFGLDGDHLGLHFGALELIWLTAWKALCAIWDPLG